MATIQRHPDVDDYILEMTLSEIGARVGGISDLIETGKLVIVKDYRLPFDFEALARLDERTDRVSDPVIARKLKKAGSSIFFKGDKPTEVVGEDGITRLRFTDRVRQAMFDHLCRGDVEVFRAASKALMQAHAELQRIFRTCFPHYETLRLIPSIRLTETLFENLHWDNHSIDDDFHQARVFCNLDKGKRVWNVSHNFLKFMEDHYVEYSLDRFAGQDPNVLVNFLCGEILGGSRETWRDTQPRHKVAFDPGEVWLGESRMISHQIYYGQRAAVYMWFVNKDTMSDPRNRFNARVDALHSKFATDVPAFLPKQPVT